MTGKSCPRDGAAHERRADTAVAVIRMHRERAKEQRRPAGASRDMPEPHRADDPATLHSDERQPVRSAARGAASG